MDDGHRWKRLTVSEAAKVLRISKDAVRKRMQRGTLRHDKTLDGRVYVYLDYEEGVDGTKGEHRGRPLQFADVASLVAVVSVITYSVGLFVFWYPISATYTGDFASAWYATSLVPRNVVVGHGVRQVFLPYLAIMLVLAGNFVVWFYISTSPYIKNKPILQGIIYNACFYLSIIGLLYCGLRYYDLAASSPPWTTWLFAAIMVAIFVLTILTVVLIRSLRPGRDQEEQAWKSITEASTFGESLRMFYQDLQAHSRYYIALVAWLFVGYFGIVLGITVLDTKPPLSKVEISGQRPAQGQLLSHADGFWYIFEQQKDKQGDKQVKLVAIPDAKVEDVEVAE